MNEATNSKSIPAEVYGSGKLDSKGREIVFIRRMNVADSGECSVWVQNGRRNQGGEAQNFGAVQPTKRFPSQAAAEAWVSRTVGDRIARLSPSLSFDLEAVEGDDWYARDLADIAARKAKRAA